MSMTRFGWSGALVLALVFALTGCDAGGAVASQLKECGFVTEGEIGPNITGQLYAPDDCYRDCLAGASCEDLADSLCGRSIDLEVGCDHRCAFRCGDDSLIGVDLVCDGIEQCPEGEDEVGCAPVTCTDCAALLCDDGSEYWEWQRCDGYDACRDGADERDCPQFHCADGQIITRRDEDVRCNGWSQCGDGSDEAGCAELVLDCS